MARGDGGSIINIKGIAAVAPSASELPYAAAKAGLNNLTQGLARTFQAVKVRCNCIMPGPFLTDISHAWDTDEGGYGGNGADEAGGTAREIVGAALIIPGV